LVINNCLPSIKKQLYFFNIIRQKQCL